MSLPPHARVAVPLAVPMPPPAHANPWHGRLRSSSGRNLVESAVAYSQPLPPRSMATAASPECSGTTELGSVSAERAQDQDHASQSLTSAAGVAGPSSGPQYSSLLAGIARLKDEQKSESGEEASGERIENSRKEKVQVEAQS